MTPEEQTALRRYGEASGKSGIEATQEGWRRVLSLHLVKDA